MAVYKAVPLLSVSWLVVLTASQDAPASSAAPVTSAPPAPAPVPTPAPATQKTTTTTTTTTEDPLKLDKEFFQNARRGDVARVKELLDARANVNYQDSEKKSALAAVVPLNKPAMIEFLVNAKADPDLQDERGRSPLFFASKYLVDDKAFEMLISKSSNLNVRNERAVTAINAATRQGNVVAVKHLLKRGADIEIGDSFGGHAIQSAENSKNNEIRRAFNLSEWKPPTEPPPTTTVAPTIKKAGEL
jgi:hypothetical protein